MNRRSGLGRGLGSLIPTEAAESEQAAGIRELALDEIRPNRWQPRSVFDEEALDALTSSIREFGVLQPILVRPDGEGGFELIAGERRWRCARRAGLRSIPAIIRDVDDVTSLAEAVVENVQRQDLNPLEEAAAYRQLIEDFGLTQEELGRRMGKSRSSVTNSLRLLQLPTSVQRLVADRRLSAGHAKALLGVASRHDLEVLAEKVAEEGWSVRQVENLVREGNDPEPESPESPDPDPGSGEATPTSARLGATRDAALLELEELLAERFSTNVSVSLGAGRGRIVIDVADLADLQRVAYMLLDDPTSSM